MLARVGRWSFRHKWAVVALWIAALVGVNFVSSQIGGAFEGNPASPDSESSRGFDAIDEYFGGIGSGLTGTIVFRAESGVDDPAVQSVMEEMFAVAEETDGVTVASPYTTEGARQIATDGEAAGTIAYATINFDRDLDSLETSEVGRALEKVIPEVEGLTVELGGQALAEFEPPESELIGLAFAIVVLIFAFGSVLAMGLPIGVALAGVGTGVGLITLLSKVMAVPEFATTLGAMIGLGVGIDYALFIVTRYRERLHVGHANEPALVGAIDTAGRAVIFAGTTVVISLAGMLVIGLPFVSGLGVAAATTVLVTMIASVTLLPAFISLAGDRIEVTRIRGLVAAGLVAVALLGLGAGISPLLVAAPLAVIVLIAGLFVPFLRREIPRREPKPLRETFPYRWSRFVQRYPWPMAIGTTLLLLLLAAPLPSLRLGFSDESQMSTETTTRRAYDLLAEGFGPGFNGPLIVTAVVGEGGGEDSFPTLLAMTEQIAATEDVASVTPPLPNDFENPEAAIVQVFPEEGPQAESTEDLVNRLRGEVIPAAVAGSALDVNVTGMVAASIDFTDYLGGRLPLFFAVVLTLSFLLLMMVFRSLLVPVKAVIMNMLSIAAAYGVVIAIFQWGWGKDLVGIAGGGPIEPFIPMMLFAIVFGLSMDYEVFLLSRIKEEYDKTGDAVNSVADGLAATARVISAAAAIMVVVFGSFMFEDDRIIKLFGAGLAIAVALDATLVRMLLVPATMELLGERNWWLPKWLNRILPDIHIEGHPDDDVVGAVGIGRKLPRDGDDHVELDSDAEPPSEPVPVGR